MKLEVARGIFLLASVAVVALALTAWEQPRPLMLGASGTHCPLPRVAKANTAVEPDHHLLLFLFGLSQGIRPNS